MINAISWCHIQAGYTSVELAVEQNHEATVEVLLEAIVAAGMDIDARYGTRTDEHGGQAPRARRRHCRQRRGTGQRLFFPLPVFFFPLPGFFSFFQFFFPSSLPYFSEMIFFWYFLYVCMYVYVCIHMKKDKEK